MKLALFMSFTEELTEEGKELLNFLNAQGVFSVKVHSVDEIDQAGRQNEKVALIFSDRKIPYTFLKNNSWAFPMKHFLYLPTKPVVKEETATKISEIRLSVFSVHEKKELLKSLLTFFNEKATTTTENIELDFTVNTELGVKK